MTPEPSPLESARFGRPVARWQPARPDERLDPDGFDVVIVRRPAAWTAQWHELTRHPGFTAVHADSLVYWEWRSSPVPDAPCLELRTDQDELAAMIRVVFADYRNHYRANPLFDPVDALEGYVEWALATAGRCGGYHVWRDPAGETGGVAVVDWQADPPDVRLAGMLPAQQGRGHYRELVRGVMAAARDAGRPAVQISTQVDHVAPQRVWAALGWKPIGAYDTTHLIRTELLAAANGAQRSR